MDVWYKEFTSRAFREKLKNYFNRRFAWRFDDPDHAFDDVMDIVLGRKLPQSRITHRDNCQAYVYSCFSNTVKDYGDSLYSKVVVPEPLASQGRVFKRLFWEFCLNRRSISEIADYCHLSEQDVRTWTSWLTKKNKCPKPGVHSSINVAVVADSVSVLEAHQSSLKNPDETYRDKERGYYICLWSEERPTDDPEGYESFERRVQSLPRLHLSTTERIVLRCTHHNVSIADTAALLRQNGSKNTGAQQIRNARLNLKKRILKYCDDHGIEF